MPERSDDVAVDTFILANVNGTNNIEAIAAMAFDRFRACIPTPEAAMDRVFKLINRYGGAPRR